MRQWSTTDSGIPVSTQTPYRYIVTYSAWRDRASYKPTRLESAKRVCNAVCGAHFSHSWHAGSRRVAAIVYSSYTSVTIGLYLLLAHAAAFETLSAFSAGWNPHKQWSRNAVNKVDWTNRLTSLSLRLCDPNLHRVNGTRPLRRIKRQSCMGLSIMDELK